MNNRREFLRNVSLFTAAGLLAGKVGSVQAATSATTATTAGKVIGLQTYSLFGELYKDVPGVLKKLKQGGYSTLELAGYGNGKINGIDMQEFKKMAEDAGLKITSSHVNPPVWEYTTSNVGSIKDFWKKTADDHARIGTKYVVQPGLPQTRSVEETQYVAEVFNEAGKIMKAAGIQFGYHNHDREFSHVVPGGKGSVFDRGAKGDVIYDLFIKSTDPSLVVFEMDVYWTVMGQNDPVSYMQKYPDRIRLLHIKDRHVLGQSGMMNFETIFNQAIKNGIKDYYVELEGMPSGKTQLEGVLACCDYLKKARFVKI
ncbi:sugar phosphate isomerase/epimerase family protein [Parabacteroides pacaensis]|uniref:sugar phosphate isomerase/epimerase family protein n=1 Tax=Parabacteroides pacaensis TaxID=2086575 RepID=UPI000D0ED9A5|nr:sugar phosphate isomerase/epimerase [Parabacteroides pacaensis]